MKIEFTKDFANKKKGDIVELDSMLARSIIDRKVAKQVTRKANKK